MRAVFPRVWLSSRAIGLLLGIALLLALASALPGLTLPFVAATVIFIAALAADAVLGPRSGALTVARRPIPSLALGRAATLEYVVRNRGADDESDMVTTTASLGSLTVTTGAVRSLGRL